MFFFLVIESNLALNKRQDTLLVTNHTDFRHSSPQGHQKDTLMILRYTIFYPCNIHIRPALFRNMCVYVFTPRASKRYPQNIMVYDFLSVWYRSLTIWPATWWQCVCPNMFFRILIMLAISPSHIIWPASMVTLGLFHWHNLLEMAKISYNISSLSAYDYSSIA